jgi:hypothetical protein
MAARAIPIRPWVLLQSVVEVTHGQSAKPMSARLSAGTLLVVLPAGGPCGSSRMRPHLLAMAAVAAGARPPHGWPTAILLPS